MERSDPAFPTPDNADRGMTFRQYVAAHLAGPVFTAVTKYQRGAPDVPDFLEELKTYVDAVVDDWA